MAEEVQTEVRILPDQAALDRAKDLLMQGGGANVPMFDQVYGQGAALRVLQGQYELPPPPEEPSMFSNIIDGVQDIAASAIRGAIGAGAEARQTYENFGAITPEDFNAVLDSFIAQQEEARGTPFTKEERDLAFLEQRSNYEKMGIPVSNPDDRPDFDADTAIQNIADLTGGAVDLTETFAESDTIQGQLTEGFTQFATAYLMLGGGRSILAGLGKGAAADAAAFEPYDANISKFMQDNEWAVPYLTEALATDADATEWENRLKNSVEGGIIGGSLEGIVAVIKLAKHLRHAKTELAENGAISDNTAAAISEAEETIKTFDELAASGKPKGQMVDGMFTTPDGMKFDPETGNRRIDLEASQPDANPTSKLPNDRVSLFDDNVPAVKPDAPALPDVQATVPKKAKAPSEVINTQALRTITARARQTNELVPLSALDMDGNDIGLINWNNTDGPPDALKMMDATQQALSDAGVLKGMGLEKVETHTKVFDDATNDLAEIVDAKPEDVRAAFLDAEKVTRTSAQRIVAGKMLLQSTGRRISDLSEVIVKMGKARNVDTAVERQLVDLLKLHADVQASVKGIQTATARAVSAGRIRTADALDDVALDRLMEFGGSNQVARLAKQIQGAKGNPKAQAKIIRKANENKIFGVINEVWLNAILSGPRTHILNMGANGFNMLLRPGIRAVGGALTGNMQVAEEGVRQYAYLMSEITDSLRYVATLSAQGNDSAIANTLKSWWTGEGVLDTSTKFDPTKGPRRAISTERGGVSGFAINTLGKGLSLSNRFLTAEDEFFKQSIFRSRLRAMVMSQARRLTKKELDALGYANKDAYIDGEIAKAINTKESLAEKFEQMVREGKILDDEATKAEFIKKNTGTFNHTSEVAVRAIDEARESTFTTPLRSGTFSAKTQQMISNFPVLRQVMPFVQTPTNILRVSFERIPGLNLLMQKQRDIVFKGAGTADERAIVMGNMALGVAAGSYAYHLAMNGRITGGGPSFVTDSNKAKLWNASPDWQPYSINMGTAENPKWRELKRLDPHGMIFGIIGDVYEMLEYTQNDPDPELGELVGMTMASFANNVMSKTYMMSLADTMRLFDGNTSWQAATNTLSYRAASMVPYSSLSYELNKAQNGHLTELRTLTDKIKSRIYMQDNSAVKHDWLTGEAVDLPDYMLGFIRQKKLDSGEHVAAGVYEEMRKLNHAFVGPQRNLGDVELSPIQYQRYNELIGTIKVNGSDNLIKTLDKQIKSRRYAALTDAAEINQTRSADDGRVKHLNIYIQLAKRKAKQQLFREYPELKNAVMSNRVNRSLSKAGREAEPLITEIAD